MFSFDAILPDFYLTIVYVISVCVLLHVFIKSIWSIYITKYCVPDDELNHLSLPPGTLGYPVIGETFEFIVQNATFYKSRRDKYGHVYRTHVMGRPTIRVSGANNIRKILRSEHSYVASQWPPSIRRVLGPNALSMMDEITEHKERKKLLSNLFQPESLNSFIPVIRKITKHYLETWCQKGKILGFSECRNLGFDVALQCLAGFDCNAEIASELSDKYEQMVYNMFSLPYNIPGLGLHKALRYKRYLMKRIGENIEQTISRKVDDNKPISALDYLVREEDPDSRYKTCESIVELMFASHDTTSSAMCSCLMFIGRNPKVLQNIRDEIISIDISKQQNVDGLVHFKYIYNVVKEVLRITPPVGAGYRRVLKSFELEGYKIPKGWTLAYGIRDTHETAAVFSNPTEFNPDRWDSLPNYDKCTDSLEERFNFAPFGGGPRMCIGKEFAKLVLRLFLIELCSNFNWTLENPYPSLRYIPVPRPSDKLPTLIERVKTEDASFNNS